MYVFYTLIVFLVFFSFWNFVFTKSWLWLFSRCRRLLLLLLFKILFHWSPPPKTVVRPPLPPSPPCPPPHARVRKEKNKTERTRDRPAVKQVSLTDVDEPPTDTRRTRPPQDHTHTGKSHTVPLSGIARMTTTTTTTVLSTICYGGETGWWTDSGKTLAVRP